MTAQPRWWLPVRPAGATLLYAAIAIAFTWPLATGLTHLVPWDLGDALLNDWILAWHYHQAGLLLRGDWTALATWWHPPIFYPAPYALGYSELLVTQALMGAPVYALTSNLLLTYNLLFLGSFVLSALGAFLLVRRMTGDARAGLIAGLLYGFALYRVTQAPHLQVLHAQWAPFVLWLLHRWFDEGRWRDACLAGAALAAQNLSNGYYLFYLALLLPPYALTQIAARGRLRDARAWAGPAVAALLAAAVTVPFMYPYVQLRLLGQSARPVAAVAYYGADTLGWITANDQLRLWGWLQTLPRPEGDLFPGLVAPLLAMAGLALTIASRAWQAEPASHARGARSRWSALRRVLVGVAAALAVWHMVAIALALFAGVSQVELGPVEVSIRSGERLLVWLAASVAALLVCSPAARRAVRDTPHAPVVVLCLLTALTVWLSFGPVVRTGLRPAAWPAIYDVLYEGVPGADALRVPPRIAMMTALLLAMLAGIGVAAWRRRWRLPDVVMAGVGLIAIAEAWPAPVPVNLTIDAGHLAPVPGTVPPAPAMHPDAMALAALPPDAVLVELPMGSVPWEIRWQYLSAGHWRARLNGYSGGFPDEHLAVEQVLGSLPDRADEAAAVLAARRVTHVVLHPQAWRDTATPQAIRQWLASLGAVPVARTGTLEVWQTR